MQNFIEYPLYDLDMREFISYDEEYDIKEENYYLYDLYAVINHVGSGMGSGHYTAIIKNEQNNNWYHYDDSTCKDITESKVRTKHAYILFYKRKDLGTLKVADIYPETEKNLFKGRPIKTKLG